MTFEPEIQISTNNIPRIVFLPFLRRELRCKNVCGQSVPEKPQLRPLFPPTTLISLAPVTQTMRSQPFRLSFHFFSDRMRRKGPNKKKQFLKHMFNVAKFSGWQVVKKKNKGLICLFWSICWHHPKSCKRRMQSFVPFTFRFPTTHRTFVSGPFSCLFSHNCTSLLSELMSELCSYPFLSHQPAPTFTNFGASWSVELSLCACCSICLNLGVDSDTLVSNKNVDRVAAGEDLDQYIFHLTHTCQLWFGQLS